MNLNIFHNNVNGLETKFENLHHFLSNDSTKFDIIAITETTQRITNEKFHTNIDLEGYANFSTPTNTNKGGTVIYTKNIYDVTERIDFNICHDLYESIWIEIIKRVKMLFVAPYTDIRMTVLWCMINF